MLKDKKIRSIIIAVLAFIIVFHLVNLYFDVRHYNDAKLEYDKIREENVKDVSGEFEKVGDYPRLSIDVDKLRSVNADFTGWLYFPYLSISYPVVKEKEIDEYMTRTFDGSYNKAGCLYEDILSDSCFCGKHDIIFGHNMKDGSMFGSLKTLNGTKSSFMTGDNAKLYVYTDDKVYEYEAFAYYVTSSGSGAYSVVATDNEYDNFVSFIKRNSFIKLPSDIDFSKRDSILTLSTCSGKAGSDGRFVLHSLKTNTWDRQ
ncbi:class B sortase [Butyrivibrio sp. X503]|uniref:class B sortase n=1 Tax=Butyrivibrio sp. X503 TaxID=2364878 RepID=UPI000EA9741D|nr:class B sortase [Butyrivibrio sp. X503]RKM54073.1 class B sortase [Butyrivibrio sp. X503]